MVVGELGKTLSPSKCRIAEIHETSSQSSFMKKVCVCEKGRSEESKRVSGVLQVLVLAWN
jgi:hypothetical protein